MNARRFRIVVVSAVILLLVGIGAFVAYDMDAPVQQVRVYEVPEPLAPRAVIDPLPVVDTENGDFGTAVQSSTESDSEYEDTTAAVEIEPCCPDGEDIDFGQDNNLDHNPVSTEVIADGKRRGEWLEVLALHEKKEDVLSADFQRLRDELTSIRRDYYALMSPEDRAGIAAALDDVPDIDPSVRQRVLDMIYGTDYSSRTNGDIISDLETVRLKQETLMQRIETLDRERPVYPSFTHKH